VGNSLGIPLLAKKKKQIEKEATFIYIQFRSENSLWATNVGYLHPRTINVACVAKMLLLHL